MVYYINENGDNVIFENIEALLNDQITPGALIVKMNEDFKMPIKSLRTNPQLLNNFKKAYVKYLATCFNLLVEDDADSIYVPSVFINEINETVCQGGDLNI